MNAHGPHADEDLVTLLTHTGERINHPDFSRYADDLDAASLRRMWHDMVVVRAFDNEATSLQRQGELGVWVQSLGQEAAQIGSGHAMNGNDFVFPSYREHGVAYTRGLDMPEILRIFRGLQHGAWDPEAHRFHLYTLVIGAHSLHATGYAMAMDRDGMVGTGDPTRDGAVICYFGDGATSQGDVNEAMVFAAVNSAPIVFFVQNNQFAISEPVTRQTRTPLAQRGAGFGIPSVRVDGNDVIACYAVTRWALERARSGGGPVLIEAFTYRMGAHTTADDPTRYRTKADESYWAERDPIARVEAYLDGLGELDQEARDAVTAEAKDMGRRTRETVRSWERPSITAMFDHVYSEPHATVDAERAWFERYESTFTDEAAHA